MNDFEKPGEGSLERKKEIPMEWFVGIKKENKIMGVLFSQELLRLGGDDFKRALDKYSDFLTRWAIEQQIEDEDFHEEEQRNRYDMIIRETTGFVARDLFDKLLILRSDYVGKDSAPFKVVAVEESL